MVHKIVQPPSMYYTEEYIASLSQSEGIVETRKAGERMAASYVNFYLANGGIVAPSFNVETDEIACQILQKCYPDRKVVMVDSRDLIVGGGNIHCLTQQQPATD